MRMSGIRSAGIGAHVRGSLWFIPVVCVGAGVALSFITLWIDSRSDYALVPRSFTGGPDAALAILGAVATSMVSLAALVLTITMVVVQLAMGQFSPRIVQPILKDRPSQFAIGIFVGTFAFAMLAMRDVLIGASGNAGQVPGLTVLVAFLLVVVSIAVLVLYVHHIGRSLRVSALIELVGSETRRLLDDTYPGQDGRARATSCWHRVRVCSSTSTSSAWWRRPSVPTVRSSWFRRWASSWLPARRSCESKVTARGCPTGWKTRSSWVSNGRSSRTSPTGSECWWTSPSARSPTRLTSTPPPPFRRSTGSTTTSATSPAAASPTGRAATNGGEVRLVVPVMSWQAYVHLAFDEIRQAGAGSPQVARRMRAALDDLLDYAPPERRPVVHEQLTLLDAAIRDRVPEQELPAFLVADRQGIGVLADTPGVTFP